MTVRSLDSSFDEEDDWNGMIETEDSIVDSKESFVNEKISLDSILGRELMSSIQKDERKSKKVKLGSSIQQKLSFNFGTGNTPSSINKSKCTELEKFPENKESENSCVKDGSESLSKKIKSGNTGLFSPFSINVTAGDEDIQSPMFDPCKVSKEKIMSKVKSNSILFSVLTDAFSKIEQLKGSGSGSKKGCIVILANLFRLIIHHNPSDLIDAVYICMNKVAPDYEGKELGIGDSILIKCISESSDRSEKRIKEDQISGKFEDLGEIASISKKQMRLLFEPPRLTIHDVYNELYSLTEISGKQSQQLKKDKIKKLLVSGKQEEVKYIVRFLQGRLRIGIQQTTVYQALASAFVLTKNVSGNEMACFSDYRLTKNEKKYRNLQELDCEILEMENSLRSSLCQLPNIEKIIKVAIQGVSSHDISAKCKLTTGIPCEPMLARPTKGIQEVLSRFENILFTAEYKYDGERAQVHVYRDKSNKRVIKIFTRNLESATDRYPDLIQYLNQALNSDIEDCILDSEVVAYSKSDDKILPFQVLSTRKRKNVAFDDIQIQICLMLFDCMEFNGESLLKKSLFERRQYLRKCINQGQSDYIKFATSTETDKLEHLDSFLSESIENNCEGLMVKTLHENASYEPSKRSLNWLKIKKDYVDGLTDSIDVVPIAACYGKGKRNGVFGTFLLAVYNTEEEVYETVCKAGTGFSDEVLQSLFSSLKDHIIAEGAPKSYYRFDSSGQSSSLKQDVWFQPKFVWEIKGADLSLSPVHTAAMGSIDENRGIGLRFPRFIRIREDKSPEQATSSIQIMEMYKSQLITRKNEFNLNEDQFQEDE
ncbi:DNA LIGASE I [Cryptosporidium sp. chipmunk genotype I]|uniref:DNA LIGASE I n=1 Tax=Cryptosporidium sp. chipmunk genotype I TaxID=1280935 RepID=UPI003519F73B|nr:DNA LIGASE I [Cryptosporidium sp. chipmunk genotype I]